MYTIAFTYSECTLDLRSTPNVFGNHRNMRDNARGHTRYKGDLSNMDTTTNQDKRIKPRISVTLKAVVSFAGRTTDEHKALVSNLSVTDARLHLENSSPLRAGMGIILKIFIPNTVLHCASEGEFLWVSRQHNAVSLGVKFKEFLSEFMLQQLIKI
jgi:hypothetical protein